MGFKKPGKGKSKEPSPKLDQIKALRQKKAPDAAQRPAEFKRAARSVGAVPASRAGSTEPTHLWTFGLNLTHAEAKRLADLSGGESSAWIEALVRRALRAAPETR